MMSANNNTRNAGSGVDLPKQKMHHTLQNQLKGRHNYWISLIAFLLDFENSINSRIWFW